MHAPLRPPDEAQRLESLRRCDLLDTPPESTFDDLTTLAAAICDSPVAAISLVDDHREWFKSTRGTSISETPRDVSFGSHAILARDVFVVPDATKDPRFADGPLATGDLRIRSYAGAPLVTADGFAIGVLGVIDRVPRALTSSQLDALRALGRQAMSHIERRLELRQLRENEARLELVTNNSRAGLVIVNSDRRYVYANGAYARILGLPSPDIVGMRVADVLGEMYEKQVRPRLDRAFAGEHVRYDLHRSDADGDSHYTVRYEPTRAGDGPPMVIVFITDVTEHRAAAVAASRLAAIVAFSDDAIIGKDLDGIITSWNAGAERLFGYSSGEIVGTSILRLIPPDRHDEEHHILGQIRRGESVRHFETVRRTKSGQLLDVSITASPIKDSNGALIGASKVARDITERNRAVEALRSAEERMRFVLENARVGIWDMDYTTGVLTWSETIEKQYGVPPGTFAGTFEAFVERVHPEDRAALLATVGQATKTGSDFTTEHRVLWPDRTVRWLSGAGRVLLGSGGEPIRAVGISRDVTARRTLEAQFHQSQKMEAVGRLAGGVAHDFNNMLTAILGYCGLILDDLNSSDPLRADITEIQKAGVSAAALTRQLLAFSRKQIIEPTLLDLNTIVSEMRGMLGRLIGEDVAVGVGLNPAPVKITADRGQVEQILLNLAVNARDAMPTGGSLTIETANVDLDENYASAHFDVKPGAYVVLTVTDTGTGMTPEVQARLFEPFFTTKEQGKGTGLGLATVHGIVARSGGSIGVYSELGKGTSFKVYFPRTDSAEIVPEAPRAAAPKAQGAHTVLVVEDASGLRELTRRILDRQGYKVLLAANADEALRLFAQHASIDLLLTDVVMPGASGPEVAKQLVEQRPDLRVIYMSGYTEEAIVHHGVLKPGIAFLHKPFTADALGRKIQEMLNR